MKTVNLQLSKELKKAGYPQEAEKWWWEDNFGLEKNKSQTLQDKKPHNPKNGWVYFASPTAYEILEQLPAFIEINDETYQLRIEKEDSAYLVGYMSMERPNLWYHNSAHWVEVEIGDNLARLWLYLKENNLLEVKG